jgi:hypothetical protein
MGIPFEYQRELQIEFLQNNTKITPLSVLTSNKNPNYILYEETPMK